MRYARLPAHRDISIHAPRMGSDYIFVGSTRDCTNFNPRSPHGERRCLHFCLRNTVLFQSTLPAWGATWLASFEEEEVGYFNPRSPHGERQQKHEISSLFL